MLENLDDIKEYEGLMDELNYVKENPVKKYQFVYDESVCMANKYPEVEAIDVTKNIEVAPGEGKRPIDMTQEIDLDIKAFPYLYDPNGSNGKDEERMSKLSYQFYFIQRILNKDQRFARSAAYKYATVAFIEKRQLQWNINISKSATFEE